jgi:hypothetical protein
VFVSCPPPPTPKPQSPIPNPQSPIPIKYMKEITKYYLKNNIINFKIFKYKLNE